jgi:hypothetical protein
MITAFHGQGKNTQLHIFSAKIYQAVLFITIYRLTFGKNFNMMRKLSKMPRSIQESLGSLGSCNFPATIFSLSI